VTFDTSHLLKPIGPWILGFSSESLDPTSIEDSLATSGITIRVLRGAQMRTREGLLNEFASQLAFPGYFGHNWDALADSLTDLSWLPGLAYAVMIEQARYLLDSARENELKIFLKLIERVASEWARPVRLGENWDRPAVPFHLLLQESPKYLPRVRERLHDFGVELPSFELGQPQISC
jgi:hypothetical protein